MTSEVPNYHYLVMPQIKSYKGLIGIPCHSCLWEKKLFESTYTASCLSRKERCEMSSIPWSLTTPKTEQRCHKGNWDSQSERINLTEKREHAIVSSGLILRGKAPRTWEESWAGGAGSRARPGKRRQNVTLRKQNQVILCHMSERPVQFASNGINSGVLFIA